MNEFKHKDMNEAIGHVESPASRAETDSEIEVRKNEELEKAGESCRRDATKEPFENSKLEDTPDSAHSNDAELPDGKVAQEETDEPYRARPLDEQPGHEEDRPAREEDIEPYRARPLDEQPGHEEDRPAREEDIEPYRARPLDEQPGHEEDRPAWGEDIEPYRARPLDEQPGHEEDRPAWGEDIEPYRARPLDEQPGHEEDRPAREEDIEPYRAQPLSDIEKEYPKLESTQDSFAHKDPEKQDTAFWEPEKTEDFDRSVPQELLRAENTDVKKTESNFNSDSERDIQDAFDFVDQHYDRDSVTWQEAANRRLEGLEQNMENYNRMEPQAKQELDVQNARLTDYVYSNALTPQQMREDPHAQELLHDYQDAKKAYDDMVSGKRACQNQIDDLTASIDPEAKTVFRGMNGSAFRDGYNDFITDKQGGADPNYQAVCGINTSCNLANQQTGSRMSEADGLEEFLEKGLCETQRGPEKNGETNLSGHRTFLEGKGLDWHSQTGGKVSFDEIEDAFNKGYSAGLMLKGDDLSQSDLSSRNFYFMNPKKTKENYWANHATTIAGFSYDKEGNATGMWLNDTGGYTNSNRVFVDRDKFEQMKNNTVGFTVEFAKKSRW